MDNANTRQVGGQHYKSPIQHWDFAAANRMDYFQGQITKYVTRWKDKGGIQDLEKARHFLDKYIELEKAKIVNDQATAKVDSSCQTTRPNGMQKPPIRFSPTTEQPVCGTLSDGEGHQLKGTGEWGG